MTNLEFAMWAGLVARRASAWTHDILTSSPRAADDAREVSIADFCDDIRGALRGLQNRAAEDNEVRRLRDAVRSKNQGTDGAGEAAAQRDEAH
jgi:hypothetical protein